MPYRDIEDEGVGVECPACGGKGGWGREGLDGGRDCELCEGAGEVSPETADDYDGGGEVEAELEREAEERKYGGK